MFQTAQRTAKSKTKKATPPHDRFLEAFRWMLLARTLEEKLVSLYRSGLITGGVYIGKGQEAVSVACGLFLQKGDIFAPLIRDQAGRSAFGEPIVDVARTYLGSRQGPMRGRDGNIHRGKPSEVPLVIVATNNHYAYSTPNDREFACADLVDRAKGYGFEGYSIDGTDLSTCLDVIGSAVKRARAGRPPQLVVASVLRLSVHGEHDDASYVTDEIKRQPFAQDCLKLAEKKIVDLGMVNTATMQSWKEDAAKQVDEAIETAQKEAAPDGEKEDWRAISTRELVDH